MAKRLLITLLVVLSLIIARLPQPASAADKMKCATEIAEYETNGIWDFDYCDNSTICATSVSSVADLSNVPEPWNSLISNVASLYPDVDPRLVAATLYIENRGWPDFYKDWAVSSAGAAGPWQFIPSTWATMGTDGDGDGIADPNNPKDAVHAAFKHQAGSAGKPIIEGYNGNIEEGWNLTFSRASPDTLLAYMANYNGSGAPTGVKLSEFPRNENSDYVRMAYYVLASNFTQTWDPATGQPVSISGGDATSGGASSVLSSSMCPSNTSAFGIVSADGFAFPVGGIPKDQLSNNQGVWPCPDACHHDGSGAFDIFAKGGNDNDTIGKPVYAIEDATIDYVSDNYSGQSGCFSIGLTGKSGWEYWYGHIQNPTVSNGQSVSAGEQIAQIGERRCTGNGSFPHLHIDRGPAIGVSGGNIGGNASKTLAPIINKLYEELPS